MAEEWEQTWHYQPELPSIGDFIELKPEHVSGIDIPSVFVYVLSDELADIKNIFDIVERDFPRAKAKWRKRIIGDLTETEQEREMVTQ